MVSAYTVCFFGHRRINDLREAERKTEEMIVQWIGTKEYAEFLVGRDGDSDIMVASCVRRVKNRLFDANSSLVCVLPYERAQYRDNRRYWEAYYDEIEICEEAQTAYPKAAIRIRNRRMIDRSDFCVFYVDEASGGAWQAMCYAKKNGKPFLNLGKME